MATTNIDVNKQNVVDLLKSGVEHRFLIPEYRRPYAWSDDEVITLFDDLWDFTLERAQPDGPKTYFLGSIVSFENKAGISNELTETFNKWVSDYEPTPVVESKPTPTPEQVEQIRKLRELE